MPPHHGLEENSPNIPSGRNRLFTMTAEQNGDVVHVEEPSSSVSDLPECIALDPQKTEVNKDALQGRVTFWLALSTFVISAGVGTQMGYNFGVMTVAAPFISEFLNRTNYEKWNGNAPDLALTWIYSCTVTIYSIGGALGAMVGGHFSDSMGRKFTLILSSALSPLAGLLMGICQTADIYGLLFLGRFISGVVGGFGMVILPVYLAEISPVNLRGAVGVFSVFMECSGQLMSHVLGFWGFYNQEQWPILLSLTGCVGTLVLIIFPFCPESPRWLFLKQKRYKDAEIALQRLRGSSADIKAELDEMLVEAKRDETKTTDSYVSVMDVLRLKNPQWKRPLFLCITMTVGFHCSGISALFFYTTEIYTTAGLTQTEIAFATVAYSATNVVSSVLGVMLVEKVGRRPLLLYPYCAGLVFLLGMTVSINTQDDLNWMKWVTIAIVFIFTITFGVGPVSVKNMLAAELWLQSTRPAGMSITMQVTWWVMAFVSLTFPLLNTNIGGYTFLVYLAFLMVATAILFRYLPETKNRTFEEISSHFIKKPRPKTKRDLQGADYANASTLTDMHEMDERVA